MALFSLINPRPLFQSRAVIKVITQSFEVVSRVTGLLRSNINDHQQAYCEKYVKEKTGSELKYVKMEHDLFSWKSMDDVRSSMLFSLFGLLLE